MAIYKETEEKEEDYKNFFKNKCCICSSSIPQNWEHYSRAGNFCYNCCKKAEQKARLKKDPYIVNLLNRLGKREDISLM